MISRQSRPLLTVGLCLAGMLLIHFTTSELTFVGWDLLHACHCGSIGRREDNGGVWTEKKRKRIWLAQLFQWLWWGSANVFTSIPHSWNDLLNQAKWPLTPTAFAPDSFICCTHAIYYQWPPLQWPLPLLTLIKRSITDTITFLLRKGRVFSIFGYYCQCKLKSPGTDVIT